MPANNDYVLSSVSGVAADWEITYLAENHGMIEGFVKASPKGEVSYGVTSYGYDYRLGDHIRIFTKDSFVDPKRPETSESALGYKVYPATGTNSVTLPAHSTCLSYSVEKFKIPVNCIGVSIGKSTYARCGVLVNVTPAEPEWEGHLTLEISNISDSDVVLYTGEGIAQMIFFFGKSNPLVTYKTKKGKYQAQSDKIVVATTDEHHELRLPSSEREENKESAGVPAGVEKDLRADSESTQG